MTIDQAKITFNTNFIGVEELSPLLKRLGANADLSKISIPEINYTDNLLKESAKEGFILILGIGSIGELDLSIRLFINKMGMNPDLSEPCFYNQDWYLKEDFIDKILEKRWYLIKREIYEEYRAKNPEEILSSSNIVLPSAILSAYTFFAYRLYYKETLWERDFIWCQDVDHNGDQIYVGKYRDIDGINKNGFSIHRHLRLRPCYATISVR